MARDACGAHGPHRVRHAHGPHRVRRARTAPTSTKRRRASARRSRSQGEAARIRYERRSEMYSSNVEVSPWCATRRWRENFLVWAPRMESALSHVT
eukprot:4302905-Prymnesium_polylepis.2